MPAFITCLRGDFWRHITWCSAVGVQPAATVHTEPEINEFNLVVVVHKYVLQLDVAVANALPMTACHRSQNLFEVVAGFVLSEAFGLFATEQAMQATLSSILHKEV